MIGLIHFHPWEIWGVKNGVNTVGLTKMCKAQIIAGRGVKESVGDQTAIGKAIPSQRGSQASIQLVIHSRTTLKSTTASNTPSGVIAVPLTRPAPAP